MFKLPNRQNSFYADTGRPILRPGAIGADVPRLGSPTGPVYTPGVAPATKTTEVKVTDPNASFTVLRKTKNPLLEAANIGALDRLNTDLTSNAKSLEDYSKKLVDLGRVNTANLAQENRTIDDIFNGTVANDLAGIRSRYAAAARRGVDSAIGAADAARKSMAAGNGMGGSSFFGRQAALLRSDASSRLAADLADRERADYGYVEGREGAALGARRRLGLDAASDILLPVQARDSMRNAELARLGQLGALDERNNFYGLDDGQSTTPYFPQYAPTPGYYPGSFPLNGMGGDTYVPRDYRPVAPAPRAPAGLSPAQARFNERERQRLRDFYTPREVSTDFQAPIGNGTLPDNFYDLTDSQQAEYTNMLNDAAYFQGNFE